MTTSTRTITDADGAVWTVYHVMPPARPRHSLDTEPISISWTRGLASISPAPAPDAAGWLVFRHEEERRRLLPVPPDWMTCTDAELLAMLREAVAAPPDPSPQA